MAIITHFRMNEVLLHLFCLLVFLVLTMKLKRRTNVIANYMHAEIAKINSLYQMKYIININFILNPIY